MAIMVSENHWIIHSPEMLGHFGMIPHIKTMIPGLGSVVMKFTQIDVLHLDPCFLWFFWGGTWLDPFLSSHRWPSGWRSASPWRGLHGWTGSRRTIGQVDWPKTCLRGRPGRKENLMGTARKNCMICFRWNVMLWKTLFHNKLGTWKKKLKLQIRRPNPLPRGRPELSQQHVHNIYVYIYICVCALYIQPLRAAGLPHVLCKGVQIHRSNGRRHFPKERSLRNGLHILVADPRTPLKSILIIPNQCENICRCTRCCQNHWPSLRGHFYHWTKNNVGKTLKNHPRKITIRLVV